MSHVPASRHVKNPISFSGNCGSDGKIGGREYFPPSLVEVLRICMMRGASGDECGNYLLGVRTHSPVKSDFTLPYLKVSTSNL
jgi:hypothetical protein